ncbi:pyridoxine 5'-phosphate synthase [Alphaproteobacteria bacterium]|nr:pyridoxine 5'-phosphate synthase [Alphaproteobacteria bacterium]MDC0462288.1 pyridoxine 5'-phosphate synthase [Alphaproteobacteria bacterium]
MSDLMARKIRLGVNIDHIATLRNARGGLHPDPVRAAKIVEASGADGITIHLREDRRHIREQDVRDIISLSSLPVNLEMAASSEMLSIACEVKPNAVCIVPENRIEITTEGGLAVASQQQKLLPIIQELKKNNIRISLFIDPHIQEIEAAAQLGADIVEFHTGKYCDTMGMLQEEELGKLKNASKRADSMGIEVHAGHGLSFDNVVSIAAIPEVKELNIGHFIIGEAVFSGLANVIQEMRDLITKPA